MEKEWYKSKMVWLNILSLVAFVVIFVTGQAIDVGEQDTIAAAIVAIVNIVLRFKTNTAVTK